MTDDTKTAPTVPQTVEAFSARLADLADGLPKRLRQCADHVAANLDRIAVSTVADLAAGADVPPSAVMRFCQIMGFAGFSDMQRLFRDSYAPGFPDYATRLANLRGGAGGASRLVAEFVEAGRLSLEGLTAGLDEAALEQAGLYPAMTRFEEALQQLAADPVDPSLRTAALEQSQTQFRLLVQGVTDYAIYMLDPGGIVSSWNAGMPNTRASAAKSGLSLRSTSE